MKKLTSVLMRFAQIELAIGFILVLALFFTGNLSMSSLGFVIAFGIIQSSFYTFLIGLLLACATEIHELKETIE